MMRLFNWVYKLSRWVLGGIFIYAGCTKLLDPKTFAILIASYGVVPDSLLMPLSVVLPALEMLAGIGLLFDIEGSLTMITGLLVLFIAILGYGIWIGLDVECGCFGLVDTDAEEFHGLSLSLYHDLAMLAGATFMYGWRRYNAIKPQKISTLINKLLKRRITKDGHI